MPKLRHYDGLGTARFVTFCCYRQLALFRSVDNMTILCRHISLLRSKHDIKIHGYVIMPNHVHLVVTPPDVIKLGVVVGQLKGRSAHEMIRQMVETGEEVPTRSVAGKRSDPHRVIWERRCYDHNCRTTEAAREKIKYCHDNPVKWGLVSSPGEWRFSSFGWYAGDRDVLVPIDVIEL